MAQPLKKEQQPQGRLDTSRLKELDCLREANGESVLNIILRLYLETTPESLDRLVRSGATDDTTAVHREAHSLKSTSANIGATEFSKLCGALERATESKKPSDLEDSIKKVVNEYVHVRTDILAYLSQNE